MIHLFFQVLGFVIDIINILKSFSHAKQYVSKINCLTADDSSFLTEAVAGVSGSLVFFWKGNIGFMFPLPGSLGFRNEPDPGPIFIKANDATHRNIFCESSW